MSKAKAKLIESLADLTPDPRNVNLGTPYGTKVIEDSLQTYGAGRSIVADKHGVVIGGNKTLEGAASVGIDKVRVVQTRGDELVVVQRMDLDLERDPKARGLALVDNRASEVGYSPDEGLLAQMLVEIAERDSNLLPATGYSDDDLRALLDSVREPVKEDEGVAAALVDRAAELQEKWKVERGDLFQIGQHKLLCGDATSDADVLRLMGSEIAVLMNTDAPYGIDMVSLKDGIPDTGMRDLRARHGDIVGDDLTDGVKLQAFLETAIRAAIPFLAENTAFYFWHPMLTQGTFFAAAAAADILIHRQIIWIKPSLVLTRSGMYHWKHELCFYGWRRGHMPAWYGDKSQTSVWEVGRDDDAGLHPTQKPVELFIRPINNHTKPGDVVYEPFAGSGSQIIAAEQTGRRCNALELSPSRCAVILERLSLLGLTPTLL